MSSKISSLGYCVFEVSDLDAWQDFAENLLGAVIGRVVPDESMAVRIDDYESRILLLQGSSDDIVAAGWEFDSEHALKLYVSQLRDEGITVYEGSTELAANRQVKTVYTCRDPDGWHHEFYFGASIAPSSRPFSSPLMKSGFVAGRLGFGHILLFAEDILTSTKFYQDKLGLTISDYITTEPTSEGSGLNATFYHVATGRHHSLAAAQNPGIPKKLGHFMLEMNELYDVGMAHDRFTEAGTTFTRSLGQHPNDEMTSFYVETPSGFHMEVGTGGIVIDDEDWRVSTYSQISNWGHRP